MRLSFTATIVAVGLCLLLAGVSQAAVRTVSWTHPTYNTDGSALPVAQITGTTVVWGTSATAMTSSKLVTGTATSTTIDFGPGTWFVAARTNANGNSSAVSNVAQVVIPQPTPNPPIVTVQAVVAGINMSPAYKILADGTRSQVVAGFVSVGSACDGPVVFKYRELSYREIATARVSWWKPTLADVRSPPRVAVACA